MTGWWATLIVGLAVLLFGRRLFWLFVGAVGFAVGLHVARAVLADRPEWVVLIAALILGLIGAMLAIVFQWLAVGLGGFAAGVEGSLLVAGALGWDGSWLWAVAFAAGDVRTTFLLW